MGLYTQIIKRLIKKMFDCLLEERTPSIKQHGKLHAGTRPGTSFGGKHLYCLYAIPLASKYSYQVCLI